MLKPTEVFGLSPLAHALASVRIAVRGSPTIPKTVFGPSALRVLRPLLGVRTWLGLRRADRRIPIYNLFNRTPTPLAAGWSVQKTQVLDFRGGHASYDSHNGTDFVVPIGTTVVAPAPGRVTLVTSDFHRGGLKVLIDHGDGLWTMSAHLGRALAPVGTVLQRGEPFALSAYSGLDAILAFPWSPPHVHFNTWLDGEPVDPFAGAGETALWRGGNTPLPVGAGGSDEDVPELTAFDAAAVERAVRACRDAGLAERLAGATTLAERGALVVFLMNYFPVAFAERPIVVASRHARRERLDLPFRPDDFSGVAFPEG